MRYFLRRAPLSLAILSLLFFQLDCNRQNPGLSTKDEPKPQSSPAQVGQIVFGENFEEVDELNNNGRPFKIINQKSTFHPNDPLAIVVMSEEPFGKTTIELMLSSVSEKGSEVVVWRQAIIISNPAKHKNTVTRFERAKKLLRDQKFGSYTLRCFREDTILAEGKFTYEGPKSDPH
jgi:hypothetical protein